LPGKDEMTGAVCFSADQARVAAVARRGRALYVWDTNTGEGRRWALAGAATCVAFHPSGGLLAVGFQDGAVVLYDALTLAVTGRLGRHESAIDVLAFHGGGRRLASGGEGVVKIWDVEGGTDLLELPLPERTAHARELLFVEDELVANVAGLTRQLVRWDGAPLPAR
jgi:pre-mRNA-processing factor 19